MYKLKIEKQAFLDGYDDVVDAICQFESINSEKEFHDFCGKVLNSWPKGDSHPVQKFYDYCERIEQHDDNTIVTPWGGVFITKHEHPLVEKYLVVKGGHYLSFEKHEKKEEHLKVAEGEGVLLQREGDDITVRQLHPGVEADFAPGEEHCIIAPKDLLIFENSLDHKGMDQDLIFIFNPA